MFTARNINTNKIKLKKSDVLNQMRTCQHTYMLLYFAGGENKVDQISYNYALHEIFFWHFLVVFHHEIVIFMTYALNTVYFS